MTTRRDPLAPAERARMTALRDAGDLDALAEVYGVADAHEAYFAAKDDWWTLRGRELGAAGDADLLDVDGAPWAADATGTRGGPSAVDGAGGSEDVASDASPGAPSRPGTFPGARVMVGGTPFVVHGITHADTDAEGRFVRRHVDALLEAGATVYCEQGIRRMYFDDHDGVCAMDDLRWAMKRCRELDRGTAADGFPASELDGLVEDLTSVASRFRETTFALIEARADVYGETFAEALGDVVAAFLTSHEDAATAPGYEAFAASKRAATDPSRLGALQRHYERAFLPQPLEREWLRRHDRELEVVTHARNERMADYAVYSHADAPAVHLVVGAAHQPGVRYYLERHRDGERDLAGFAPVG